MCSLIIKPHKFGGYEMLKWVLDKLWIIAFLIGSSAFLTNCLFQPTVYKGYQVDFKTRAGDKFTLTSGNPFFESGSENFYSVLLDSQRKDAKRTERPLGQIEGDYFTLSGIVEESLSVYSGTMVLVRFSGEEPFSVIKHINTEERSSFFKLLLIASFIIWLSLLYLLRL